MTSKKIKISIPSIQAQKLKLFLNELPVDCRPSNVDIPQSDNEGLAMGEEFLTAIWEISKTTLPAIISAIGVIWAAKIAAANKSGGSPRRAVMDIHTETRCIKYRLEHGFTEVNQKVEVPIPLDEEVREIVLTHEKWK
jgi:hypothetical protein